MTRISIILFCILLGFAACGRKGELLPPPGSPDAPENEQEQNSS